MLFNAMNYDLLYLYVLWKWTGSSGFLLNKVVDTNRKYNEFGF